MRDGALPDVLHSLTFEKCDLFKGALEFCCMRYSNGDGVLPRFVRCCTTTYRRQFLARKCHTKGHRTTTAQRGCADQSVRTHEDKTPQHSPAVIGSRKKVQQVTTTEPELAEDIKTCDETTKEMIRHMFNEVLKHEECTPETRKNRYQSDFQKKKCGRSW